MIRYLCVISLCEFAFLLLAPDWVARKLMAAVSSLVALSSRVVLHVVCLPLFSAMHACAALKVEVHPDLVILIFKVSLKSGTLNLRCTLTLHLV